jgi:hypothetical protein
MKNVVKSIFELFMPNDEEKEAAEPYSEKIFYILFIVFTLILLMVVL